MRFTITALGAVGGRTVDQVVGDIVRYLDRPRPTPAPTGDDPASGATPASGYYADSGEEAGRWLGIGAAEAGLEGTVDSADFARVLAGRDPRSGTRLVTASGSAGRRPTLGRGAETRRDSSGQPLYDEADAASALGLDADDFGRLIAAGMVESIGALAGRSPGPAGSYLVPNIDADGAHWITEAALSRVEHARACGPTADEVARAGGRDDLLSIADAARLVGVTSQYLRGLARHWEKDRARIEASLDAGERPRRAYIVASRGTNQRWLVKRSELVDFVSRRRPPAVRVGFDLTLTTEKSLGVLALMGGSEARRATLDAINTGNDAALQWWEQRAAVARVGGERVSARGWTAASFRHLTSRALDPFPHHHNVVANAVELDAGERRTLDARSLYRHAVGASAVATAEMRYQLTAELGVRWRQSDSRGWEIAGIPREVLRELSRRRTEIDDALAELEEAIGRVSTIDELQDVIATTRPPKQQADAADLRRDWWHRARALGFDPGQLAACVGRQEIRTPDIDELFAHLAGPDGVCATASVFTRDDVLAAMVDVPIEWPDGAQPPMLRGRELDALADQFLATGAVVQLHPAVGSRLGKLGGEEAIFTIRDLLVVQDRIVSRFRRAGGDHGRVPAEALTECLDRASLSDEQSALVRRLCASGRQFQCAVGRAGSGKTTAMRAAAVAWRAAGYRVVGTAVKGEAARQLGREAGIPVETLAWYLAHDDPGRPPFDARTVVIVDEASTIGDRDLDRLFSLASRAGATVRLIGDPAQHGAVAAGGMFRVLCERHPGLTPELHTSRRLLHPSDRAAVDALRDGDVDGALDALRDAGHLHLAADDAQLYARLLRRWWDARRDGQPHPLVERSNHRRRQLNRLAHRLLQVHGDIGADELAASGDRAFSIGDEVMARRANRGLHPDGAPDAYVRNGARGVVTRVTRGTSDADDAVTVDFGDGPVAIPRSFFDAHPGPRGRVEVGIDHAYAVTSYAVQGATFESSTSRIDERSSRAETYVDITRGRHENHLYATRAADPLDGERLPKAPDPPLDVALSIRLRASGSEVTAWELDPHALARTLPRVPAAPGI